MELERIRLELRVLGRWVALTPLAVIVIALLCAAISLFSPGYSLSVLVTALLELVLPLVLGIIVVTISSQDTAIELQLTMPRSYRFTVVFRLGLVVGGTILLTLVAGILFGTLRLWIVPAQVEHWNAFLQVAIEQLAWLAPVFVFVALGFCLTLLLRSRSASGAVLGAIWTLEVFFVHFFAATSWLQPLLLFATTYTPDVPFWMTTRLELVALAFLPLVLGWFQLSQSETLLRASTGGEE